MDTQCTADILMNAKKLLHVMQVLVLSFRIRRINSHRLYCLSAREERIKSHRVQQCADRSINGVIVMSKTGDRKRMA
jgi:hypothetical protein